MEEYKKRLAMFLAETGALFFDRGLVLKDGRPTPYFVNMAMCKTGRTSLQMGSFFAEMMVHKGLVDQVDVVLGPSYKGSAIALATAMALWLDHHVDKAFDYDRKEPKTHGEASRKKGLFVNNSLFDGCGLFIVDDVATTMGTKLDLLNKIHAEAQDRGMTCRLVGIGIGINREQTTALYDQTGAVLLNKKGEDPIRSFEQASGVPVYSVANIREVVGFLYKEGVPVLVRGTRMPLDQDMKQEFDMYMETYGTAGPLQ